MTSLRHLANLFCSRHNVFQYIAIFDQSVGGLNVAATKAQTWFCIAGGRCGPSCGVKSTSIMTISYDYLLFVEP